MYTTRENLLRLMCLPLSRFEGVVRTSDGYYLAQVKGDLGYNAFLGKPHAPHPGAGMDFMLKAWKGLTTTERIAVLALAHNPGDGLPICLARDFGVPVEQLT